MAFQEMESFRGGSDGGVNLARDFLLERNPGYAAAASGDWREFPSTQPIFYRTDRFRLVDQGWFFFSTTPDVIYSRTFNGSWPAFASWAEFAPPDGGPAFRVVNVHFEYRSASNRILSAELVRDRIAPVIAGGTPVFLVGDINARRRSPTAERIAEAGIVFAPVEGSTYHFDRGLNLFFAIDHIGATPDLTRVGGPVVLQGAVRGRMALRPLPGLRGLRAAALGTGGVQDAVGPVLRAGGRGRYLPALPGEGEGRAPVDEVEPEAFVILAHHRAGLGPGVEAIGEEVLEIPRRLEQDHLLGRRSRRSRTAG